MTLDVLGPRQQTLDRPVNPRDPNGIAHATNSSDTGDGVSTKTSRAAAKIAWSEYVQDYKQALIVGDSSGPPQFPDNIITYANDVPLFVNPVPAATGAGVSVVSDSPFGGGGNSYLFSGTSSGHITYSGSDDWAVGTGDFTIEWFSKQTSLISPQFQRVLTVGDFPTIKIGVSIETGTFYYWANNSFRYSSSGASTVNTWIHWAVVRNSGITRVYRNGTQLGSQITDANNITDNTTALVIGNTNTYADNAALVGNLTNLRWVKGLAVYTGNFTVPTSSLSAAASANPYGGSNTQAIPSGATKLLLIP